MRWSNAEPLEDRLGYALAAGITALATGICAIMAPHVAAANLVMIYLLGITYVASRCSPRPAVLASLLGVGAYDFFFVPPGGTLAVADVQYVFTFGVMLVVSLLISTLALRLRHQSKARSEVALRAQLEKTRGDLLSAVSHDLRTPLASIEGSADALLRQDELSEQSRQLSRTIQDESRRMARLIRNLLDMTRVQGVIDLELDWYGLDELAANAIVRTEAMFERPVQLKLEPRTPLVKVDGVLIEQVFVNLLENAARYAGPSALVTIGILPKGTTVAAEVCDNGPGISIGDEQRIFDRFHGEKSAGFGLGLAICRAAVEAHGGTVQAENRPEGGARFVIELPSDQEDRHV